MHDRLIEKAKKLGINTSSGNSLEQLEEIALQLGISDFDPTGDLSILENVLDLELGNMKENNNVEMLEGNDDLEKLNSDISNSSVADNYQQRPKFGEEEYNVAKDNNGKFDKDYYKKKGEELDQKVEDAKAEKDRDFKKKDPKDDGPVKANGSNTAGKNKFDKLKDSVNLGKSQNERFQNKINNAKAKAYQVMHPGEALKDKAKFAAKEGTKKVGKVASQTAGKAAKAAGKAIINLIKSNPYVLLIVAGVALIILIILMISGSSGGSGSDYSTKYFEKTCDFNNTIVTYNYCELDKSTEVELETFVVGAINYLVGNREFGNVNSYRALVIAIKTKILSMGNYNNETQKINIDGCEIGYTPSSDIADVFIDLMNNSILSEVNTYLYLSKSYTGTITSLSSSNDLEINLDDFDQSGSYTQILSNIYQNDNLTLYDITEQCESFMYGTGNNDFWWPIGSANVTMGSNIYGGSPTATYISSPYGMRIHPKSGELKMHTGIDIAAGCGQVIIAAKTGVVKTVLNGCENYKSNCGSGYGNYIIIEHEDGTCSLYAHMQNNSAVVKVDDEVAQGQKIGLVGTTGISTGCHLHFEIRVNGSYVNPLDYVNAEKPREIIN